MSDESPREKILTPEELEDLLESHRGGGDGSDDRLARRLPRASRSGAAPTRDGPRELRRAIEDCATRWGRQMASSYQRQIECSLIGWDEFETADIAPTLMDNDEVVCFSLGSETGFVLLARPLFCALLGLEFGTGSGAKPTVGPLRAFSGIERRLLTRLVRDLLAVLESSWQPLCTLRPEIIGLATRADVLERVSRRIILASVDVTALETVGRLRIAIPTGAFDDNTTAVPESTSTRDTGQLRRSIENVTVTLRAEVGSSDLSLSQLADLRVGDVIPIRATTAEGLLIRLEGHPKFRAIPGRVGSRLAAQAVGRC